MRVYIAKNYNVHVNRSGVRWCSRSFSAPLTRLAAKETFLCQFWGMGYLSRMTFSHILWLWRAATKFNCSRFAPGIAREKHGNTMSPLESSSRVESCFTCDLVEMAGECFLGVVDTRSECMSCNYGWAMMGDVWCLLPQKKGRNLSSHGKQQDSNDGPPSRAIVIVANWTRVHHHVPIESVIKFFHTIQISLISTHTSSDTSHSQIVESRYSIRVPATGKTPELYVTCPLPPNFQRFIRHSAWFIR